VVVGQGGKVVKILGADGVFVWDPAHAAAEVGTTLLEQMRSTPRRQSCT